MFELAERNILDMHARCLDYLLNIQKANNSFYFVPRRQNNLNRLDKGYFFIGNDDYMQISFWDGGDSLEKIHNISWGTTDRGISFIEISAKDNVERATFLAELVANLEEKTGVIYQALKTDQWHHQYPRAGKWRYSYPKGNYYLDTLQSFIEKEKLIIDEFLRLHPETGIRFLDEMFNNKYVLPLYQKAYAMSQIDPKKKTEGTVSVSPSSYVMAFHHNELQNAMVEYFNKNQNYYSHVTAEEGNVDITVKTTEGDKLFYELKTSDVKLAIRLAIGQLLEYCHYPSKTKANKLVIVTKYAPTKDDLVYIKKLRDVYQLPIYYQQFDMEKKRLSELY